MKKEFEVKCKNCGKIFTVIEEETKFPIKRDKYFCCRSCANTRHHSEETKKKISNTMKTSARGYIVKPREYITHCKYCGKEIKFIGYKNFKLYCSPECKHNYLSEHTGGYRENSTKKFKSGWYKGIHCDSSYELVFVIYYLYHNLYIERCKECRKYLYNGKQYNYYPDFVTDEGIIEIKGYISEKEESKRNQNPDIIVKYFKDLKPYFDYVQNTYGNNFLELYDNSKSKLDFMSQKYIFVHKDGINKMIKPVYFNDYINQGWIKGRYIK